MARIVRFHQTGGPEVLKIENVDVPQPANNEVRIQVKAIGLNRAESMFRQGQYLEDPEFPSKLGYEAAGIVESVGMGISSFKPGDAVSTIPAFSQKQYGVYGDLALVPAAAVVKHPNSLSFVDAAAVWMQYLTAYGALIEIGKLKDGEFVLIPAASSSVGLAAIQIANMVGATPIALTRKGNKREALAKDGAKHVVATEEQDVVAEVNRITGGKGARIAFDPVGGPAVNKLVSAMSSGGTLFLYGALSTEPTPLPLFEVLAKTLTIRGYVLFEVTKDPARLERGKQFVSEGLQSGKLKPVIAKTFPFEQIVDAHRYLESNQQIGKIVVTVP
jgi:NADPH:quinone reductase-like Zn-dependent oxidoreductase